MESGFLQIMWIQIGEKERGIRRIWWVKFFTEIAASLVFAKKISKISKTGHDHFYKHEQPLDKHNPGYCGDPKTDKFNPLYSKCVFIPNTPTSKMFLDSC